MMRALAALAGLVIAASPLAVAGTAPETCTVEDATLTWGFKESFRSYISGAIANGEWTVADGATYETPSFTFHDGEGTYGEAGSSVAFGGAIRFTGHGGILDTTVSKPVIEWSGHDGTLYLDVSGTTQAGDPVDAAAVPFATLALPDPGVDGDPRIFGDIAVTLTEEGSAAFGTYEAGETFDPITLDLGTVDDGVDERCALIDVTSSTTWWLVFGTMAAALFVVVALVAVTVVTIRRRARSAHSG